MRIKTTRTTGVSPPYYHQQVLEVAGFSNGGRILECGHAVWVISFLLQPPPATRALSLQITKCTQLCCKNELMSRIARMSGVQNALN